MYLKCDLRTFDLSTLGTKFDCILVDPPWKEYRSAVVNAVLCACSSHMTVTENDAQGKLCSLSVCECELAVSAVMENMRREVWTLDEIRNLRIDLIAANPSFIFVWVGATDGVEQGWYVMTSCG